MNSAELNARVYPGTIPGIKTVLQIAIHNEAHPTRMTQENTEPIQGDAGMPEAGAGFTRAFHTGVAVSKNGAFPPDNLRSTAVPH